MALTDMKTILEDAYANRYAVLAANLLSVEMIKAGIRAAEDLQAPLILQIAPVQFEYSPLEIVGPMLVAAARNSSTKVCVHLDHGGKMEEVKKAIELGFTSVMIDASRNDFEENIRRTREVSDYAHPYGVTVESELGSVGDEGVLRSDDDIKASMTDPKLAKEFVERTKCDVLAVAIGNAHGPYVKYPNLDFERLEAISNEIRIPLVLHGGSGTSDADFRMAISKGITKINIATTFHNTVGKVMQETDNGSYFVNSKKIEQAVYEVAKRHIILFGSAGKANNL